MQPYLTLVIIQLLALVLMALCQTSCGSFVVVALPKSQLANAIVFEDYATAAAALTAIYAKIRDQGLVTGTPSSLSTMLGLYADELNCYGSPADPDLPFSLLRCSLLLQERRWELFSEYGHRFFDLKRSGQIGPVLSATKTGWNSTDKLFPLPQNELSINPNLLPQNSGY